MWVFPRIGVPQNGWFIMEHSIQMDDLGVPPFKESTHVMNHIECNFNLRFRSIHPKRGSERVHPVALACCFSQKSLREMRDVHMMVLQVFNAYQTTSKAFAPWKLGYSCKEHNLSTRCCTTRI